jgi:putative NADH-flavin reductase
MKLLILGATGSTGLQVLTQALNAGHEVTVFVRNPLKLKEYTGKIIIINGDLKDVQKLEEAVNGQDAVISALGYKNLWDKSLFISKALEVVVNAMSARGVNKLVYESAVNIGGKRSFRNPFLRNFLRIFGADNPFIDHNLTEHHIKLSNLNWTIVRPGMLTNGALRAKYRAGGNVKMVLFISRADVAHCMIDSLTNENYFKKAINISY